MWQMATREPLPCSDCRGLCCGPVPVTRRELREIRRWVRALPRPQLSALREQPRYWGTCIFYDEGANACGIHPVKPSICRAYGLYANLRCFRDPGAAADSPWRVDEAPAGVLSVDFTWSDFR